MNTTFVKSQEASNNKLYVCNCLLFCCCSIRWRPLKESHFLPQGGKPNASPFVLYKRFNWKFVQHTGIKQWASESWSPRCHLIMWPVDEMTTFSWLAACLALVLCHITKDGHMQQWWERMFDVVFCLMLFFCLFCFCLFCIT